MCNNIAMNKFKAVSTTKKSSLEMFWVQYGYEKCDSNLSFGPDIKNHFVIHFIISGKGKFFKENQTYELSEGDSFVIFPKELISYQADNVDPWEYFWIGINGSQCKDYLALCEFEPESPIVKFQNHSKVTEILHEIINTDKNNANANFKITGLIYLLFSHCIKDRQITKEKSKDILLDALEYIENNFSHQISVQEIADHCFVNRSHLYKIFKNKLDLSPQEYITHSKLTKAKEFLRSSNLTVTYISEILSFQDPSHFSKQFKDKFKVSPLQFRKNSQITK